MRAIGVIAWREFKSLVTRPLFFGISGFCTTFWTYKYLRDLQAFALASARPSMGGGEGPNIHFSLFVQHLSSVHLLMLFIIPALTMRLLSEEKKQKTYDLLLTSPINSYQIALGKFLGGYMVVLLLIVIAFLYPLGTSLVADFHWGSLISSFFGLALVAGAYVSVGLFSSSLTSSPIMSFIMTIIFYFVLLVFRGWGQSDRSSFLGYGFWSSFFEGSIFSFYSRSLSFKCCSVLF